MSRLVGLALSALALVLAIPSVAPAQPQSREEVEKILAAGLEAWQIPGLSVVVVQRDRVILLRGFGVRELGKPDAVTADTIFPLASCTKPFTSLFAGMLADEKKLDWDDPVRKHLPWFKLVDPLASQDATIRDLLSHRSGVSAHDLLWVHSPFSLEDRVKAVSKTSGKLRFRQDFEYNTILFGAAALAGEKAGKVPWSDAVADRIFKPLGMTATTAVFPKNAANLAVPHRRSVEGVVAPIGRYPIDQPDPAGSIHSTARDLAAFLRLQLGDGTFEGRRLISKENLQEPHEPQIVLRMEGAVRDLNPDTLFLNYGLGWIVQDHRGMKLLMHGGVIDGFRCHFTLVPRHGLGIALLNNLDRTLFNLAASHTLVDAALGLPARDWLGYYLRMQQAEWRLAKEQAEAVEKAIRSAPKMSRSLDAYAGEFFDDAYGKGAVAVEKGELVFRWSALRSKLTYFKGDEFVARDAPFGDAIFEFVFAAGTRATELRALTRTFRRTR